MYYEKVNLIHKKIYKNCLSIGNKFFLIGTFFLPSTLILSSIFLLIALIISIININFHIKKHFSKKILICFTLIILSTLNNTFISKPLELYEYSNLYIWLSLFNWLPFIIIAWGLRIYLLHIEQRIVFSKYLIAGTMPVLFSCIIQLWFGIDEGPYSILNELIIWFQYPIKEVGGLTGLFNNQNVTGMWLSISLALGIGLIKEENNKLSKISLIAIITLIIYFIFLTNSRNAFIGLLIALLISTGIKRSFLTLVSFFSFFYFTNILHVYQNKSYFSSIPFKLLNKFELNYGFFEDRIFIWNEAIKLILRRPLFGWGGSTFSYLIPKNEIGFTANHTHNIALELAYSFGIPVLLLLTFFTINLARKSFKKIFLENKHDILTNFDKSWFLSFVIIFVSHTTDMTFFDGRISLILAIIISGLINIIYVPNKLKVN